MFSSAPYPSRHRLVRNNMSSRPKKAHSAPEPASLCAPHPDHFRPLQHDLVHPPQYKVTGQQRPFVTTSSLPLSTSGDNFQVDPVTAHAHGYPFNSYVPYNQVPGLGRQDVINIEPPASALPAEPNSLLGGSYTEEPLQEPPPLDPVIDFLYGQDCPESTTSSLIGLDSSSGSSSGQASLGSNMPFVTELNFPYRQASPGSNMPSSSDYSSIHPGPQAEFGVETFHHDAPQGWIGAPQLHHPALE